MPQHNETILSLLYCKLSRPAEVIAEDWYSRLRKMAADSNYKEKDRCFKEQFIYGLNDVVVIIEIS